MDGLKKTQFLQDMKDRIHLTQYDAVYCIDPELAKKTLESERKQMISKIVIDNGKTKEKLETKALP